MKKIITNQCNPSCGNFGFWCCDWGNNKRIKFFRDPIGKQKDCKLKRGTPQEGYRSKLIREYYEAVNSFGEA